VHVCVCVCVCCLCVCVCVYVYVCVYVCKFQCVSVNERSKSVIGTQHQPVSVDEHKLMTIQNDREGNNQVRNAKCEIKRARKGNWC
jgi:hypothetical protein